MRKILYISFLLSAICYPFCGTSYNLNSNNPRRVYTGLENFLNHYASKYQAEKFAVVTNHSGVNYHLMQNINLFRNKKIEITLVLAPEHGLYGYENEYNEENYLLDDDINLIVYNLHHLNSDSLRHLLKVADFVIFDIQDMGMRCYTYLSALKFIMDTIAGTDIELLVLDRPNPLGFLDINGPFLENNFYSKNISSFPVPLFYNMTIGEASLYYKGEYQDKINLKVIPMKGYSRKMPYNDTKLPWIPPSPNLPSYMSAIIYSAVVLLEGINISLGRGTASPFEYIGAPWIEPRSFCRGLRELDLKNFVFRPVYFKPCLSKYENEKCGGAHIIYTGGDFNPMEISYKLILYIMKNYNEFQWETFNNSYNIDYLAGTDKFRIALSQDKEFNQFSKEIKKGIDSFSKKRKKYLIYHDDYNPL